MVLVDKTEDLRKMLFTRKIISFRNVGETYRRDDEIHQQRLYRANDLATELRRVGFRIQIRRGYGDYTLPPAHAALIARKPQ